MLKSQEIAKTIENKMEEIKNLAGEEKRAMFEEIKNLKSDFDIQKEVEAIEYGTQGVENKVENQVIKDKIEEPSLIRSMIKNAMKTPLTAKEQEVIRNAVTGEEHIELKELSTRIHELLRHEETLKHLVTVHKTAAKTGAFPVNKSTASSLVEIVDGQNMNPGQDLTFEQITFAIKKYGLLGQLTDTVLKYTTADLIGYMAKMFVKAYVKKVNEMVCVLLLEDGQGTKKQSVDLGAADRMKGLVSRTRLDLDPAVRKEAILLMSPEAFDILAKEENGLNICWLQPDLSKPATPYINGYRVEFVYDSKFVFEHNGQGQAPGQPGQGSHNRLFIAFSNTKEHVFMFENEEYTVSFSYEAGFLNNTVYSKIITYFDMQEVDKEATVLYHIDVAK